MLLPRRRQPDLSYWLPGRQSSPIPVSVQSVVSTSGLFLVSVAGLIFSLVMLRSTTFSRSIAIWGILANAVSLADYLRQALTDSPIATLLVVVPNMILLIIWFCLLGRHFSRLGRD